MEVHLLAGDTVLVSLTEHSEGAAHESATVGRVTAADDDIVTVSLVDGALLGAAMAEASRFYLRRITSSGILEFRMDGRMQPSGQRCQLQGRVARQHRVVQRRNSCRVEINAVARYCTLPFPAGQEPAWTGTELRDVSLTGASLMPAAQGTLAVGARLLLEFTLNGEAFSMPAAVVRASEEGCTEARLGVEYSEINTRQQDRLARAIIQLQLKLISSRVRLN